MAPRALSSLFLAASAALFLAACSGEAEKETADQPSSNAQPSTDTGTSSQQPDQSEAQTPELEKYMSYKADNDAFAEEYRNQEGVIILPSGTAYRTLEEGEGASPTLADLITVSYAGRLIDGTQFDGTKGDDMVEFPLGRLIQAWKDVLTQMKPGQRVEIMVPQDQGYGGRASGPIPAFSTLLFEMKLHSFRSESAVIEEQAAPGRAYLAENAEKEGVIVTESGLQYRIIKQGTGPIPGPEAIARIDYEGRTIDGTVFDSSKDAGQPLSVQVARSLPGWAEAIQMMPVGSVYEIVLPYELGLGARALSEEVPGYSTLIFTFELLGFLDPAMNAAYLEDNAKKEGVEVRDSGLQFRVIKEGEGDRPIRTSKVEVHYRGTLVDGTEFDSSYKRGETITFPVTGVIQGWIEGLQLMRPGGKYELVIPSNLGYGPGGSGSIPPNSTLVFEIELVNVFNGADGTG